MNCPECGADAGLCRHTNETFERWASESKNDTPAPAPSVDLDTPLVRALEEQTRQAAKEPAALGRADARNLYEMLLELRNDLKNNLNRVEHAIERFSRFKD